jgi:hypothetical protein
LQKLKKLVANENFIWNTKEDSVVAAGFGSLGRKCGSTKLELRPG